MQQMTGYQRVSRTRQGGTRLASKIMPGWNLVRFAFSGRHQLFRLPAARILAVEAGL